jgi:Flp pilus assembly protein TadG
MIDDGFSQSQLLRKTKLWSRLFRVARSSRYLRSRSAVDRCCNSDGQALVETAVSLTILLTLVFGLINVGMALYSYNFVSEAAREGSRYAMVRGSSCTSPCTAATAASIQTYVQSLGYPGLNPSNLTVTTTWPDTGSSCTPSVTPCNNPGNNVMVKASYAFPWSVPFIPSSTLTMSSTSEVIISQ